MNKRPIAIIGGMGPEASAFMYQLLIKQSIGQFGAINNDDFPEIILLSVPVPDFISSDKMRGKALAILKERTVDANKIKPICLAIACNTAHVLISDLQKVSAAPFISIVDETVKAVKKEKYKTVGLLGTPSTIKYKLYQNALEKVGIKTTTISGLKLKIVENIIRNIIAGKINKSDELTIKKITDDLVKNGAQAIVLGCTELPIIFPKNYNKKVFNSLEILSLALLKKYYGQTT